MTDPLTVESIADDATLDTGRGSTQQKKRNTRLFAVKNTYNQLLDLARETLKENKDDIQECRTPLCLADQQWSSKLRKSSASPCLLSGARQDIGSVVPGANLTASRFPEDFSA